MARIPQSLYLIHFMLMLSPALFAAVIYFGALPGETNPGTSNDEIRILQTVAAVLAVIAVGLSQLVPRFLTRDEKSLPLRRFASMKIVQWALLEGAAVFIGVVFFLTHQKSMLIPLAVLIALIAFMRPTTEEIVRFNVKE
ncbi:MAG: hypothetical protein J0L53_05440 [Spirochaetes bacterium]|nr:hypothetical protein [Spirochaetota bacterium]MBX3721774.1 hypothetical protein [Turneriella sp.]